MSEPTSILLLVDPRETWTVTSAGRQAGAYERSAEYPRFADCLRRAFGLPVELRVGELTAGGLTGGELKNLPADGWIFIDGASVDALDKLPTAVWARTILMGADRRSIGQRCTAHGLAAAVGKGEYLAWRTKSMSPMGDGVAGQIDVAASAGLEVRALPRSPTYGWMYDSRSPKGGDLPMLLAIYLGALARRIE